MLYRLTAAAIAATLSFGIGCGDAQLPPLTGAAAPSATDAHAILMSRTMSPGKVYWVSTESQAADMLRGRLAPSVDWALCSQGVVAYLLAVGVDVTFVAVTYTSEQALQAVWHRGRPPKVGDRTMYVPGSTIEFGLWRFLSKNSIPLAGLRIMNRRGVRLADIVAALERPPEHVDAIDFAVLPEPYLTSLESTRPGAYQFDGGGFYEMQYGVVAKGTSLRASSGSFTDLIQQFALADRTLRALDTDDEFYALLAAQWGRPARHLPKTHTFNRTALQLSLRPSRLRALIQAEIDYLVAAYPSVFRGPLNADQAVTPSILLGVLPAAVSY